MANLPEDLFAALVAQIAPHMGTNQDRKDVLLTPLSKKEVWNYILWDGLPHHFTVRLVDRLSREDLVAVLKQLRPAAGDEQRDIDALIRQLTQLPREQPEEPAHNTARASAYALPQAMPDLAGLLHSFSAMLQSSMRQSGAWGPAAGPGGASLLEQLGRSQLKAPRPAFDDLFEIVTDSQDVLPALYRTGPEACFDSYQMPYIRERADNADVQSELSAALLDAGGRLVVQSRAGLGKTREAAELAKDLCGQGWLICVPKAESDRLLNPPDGLPPRLYDEKLLLVFDDVHRRLQLLDIEGYTPYATRLAAFLESFDAEIKRGTVYVVATAQSHALEPGAPPWDTFRAFYSLPEFTVAGLTQLLIEMAHGAGVPVDEAEAQALVEVSDRTLRTLCLNIESAREEHRQLSRATWLEAHGGRLSDKFRAARVNYPAAPAVFEALHLLRQSAVPARRGYVHQLSSERAGQDTSESIDGLLSTGLLGERCDLLYALNDVQIAESLQAIDRPVPAINQSWRQVVAAVQEGAAGDEERKRDLVTLARSLIAAQEYRLGESVASVAARKKPAGAGALLVRGLARAGQGKDDAAIKDFTAAARSPAVAGEAYYNRGLVFSATWEADKAAADFTAAIAAGMSSADVFYARGLALSELGKHAPAEADFTAAIAAGMSSAEVYRERASVRSELEKFAEAEADWTAAIDAGEPDAYLFEQRGDVRAEQGRFAEAEADFSAAIAKSDESGWTYLRRGVARLVQGRDADADADFAKAVADLAKSARAGGAPPPIHLARGMILAKWNQTSSAEPYLTAAIDAGESLDGMTDGFLLIMRGLVRMMNEKWAEAESDLDMALDATPDSSEVAGPFKRPDILAMRSIARMAQGRIVEAEADLAAYLETPADGTMLDRPSALVVFGLVQASQERLAEAEASFSKAISADDKQGLSFFLRALARLSLGAYAGARADLKAAVSLPAEGEETAAEASAEILAIVALTHLIESNYEEAVAELTPAIETGPATAMVYGYRAEVRIHQGLLAGAEQDCATAAQLEPDGEHALACRALLHLARREYDGAIESYRRAYAAATEPGPQASQGLALLLAGHLQEALEVYRQHPAKWRPDADYALAELAFWTRQQADRVSQPDAAAAVAEIRALLTQAVEDFARQPKMHSGLFGGAAG